MSLRLPKHSRRIGLFCRLAITGALIALVAARLDLRAAAGELRSVGWLAVLAAVAIQLAQVAVLGYRWQRILVASDIALNFRRTLKIVLIGTFFNQCLPTSLGGDAVRAIMLRSAGVPLERSINAVLVDRLSGLAGLLPFLVLGLPFALAWTDDRWLRLAGLGVTMLYGVFLAAYFFADRAIARLRPLARLGPLRAVSAASVYARHVVWHSPQALAITALALLTHLFSVVLVAVLAAAMRAPISAGAALVLVPPVIAVAMLPISYGGWGARELAMVAGLGLAGVPAPTALAISILVGFVLLLSAIPGAILLLTDIRLRAEARAASSPAPGIPQRARRAAHP